MNRISCLCVVPLDRCATIPVESGMWELWMHTCKGCSCVMQLWRVVVLFRVDPLRCREQVIDELGHTLWKAARESLTKGMDSGQGNEPPSEGCQQLDRVCGCSAAVSHQPITLDAWLLSEKELTYCWHAVMGKATLRRMG